MVTSSVKSILKAMIDTVYLGPSLGVVRILYLLVGGFFNQRGYSGADWLDLLIYISFLIQVGWSLKKCMTAVHLIWIMIKFKLLFSRPAKSQELLYKPRND